MCKLCDFGGVSIGANSIEAAGGVFSVNESGAVTATNLSSSGSVSATSGDIGGFVIASGELTSTFEPQPSKGLALLNSAWAKAKLFGSESYNS